MSDDIDTEEKAPVRPVPRRGPGGGGPFGGMGGPVEKSMNFGPSAKRLAGRLRPEAWGIVFVTLLVYVAIIAAKLSRLERETGELAELARQRRADG